MTFEGHRGLCPWSGSKDIEKNPQKQDHEAYFQRIKWYFRIYTPKEMLQATRFRRINKASKHQFHPLTRRPLKTRGIDRESWNTSKCIQSKPTVFALIFDEEERRAKCKYKLRRWTGMIGYWYGITCRNIDRKRRVNVRIIQNLYISKLRYALKWTRILGTNKSSPSYSILPYSSYLEVLMK